MILVITAERITGLQYHRQVVPFENLGLDFEFRDNEFGMTDDYLKRFSCISFLREIKTDPARYKKLGLKIHFDIDDYWVLPVGHPMQKEYIRAHKAERTIQSIKDADFVTTTTKYLANRIKEFNPNVYVCSNAIDINQDQWKSQKNISKFNRIRFGYIAGVHHVRDVEMLHHELMNLWKDGSIKDKWQLCMAGFNFNKISETEIKANPYYRYVEQIFTSGKDGRSAYGFLKENYAKILKSEHPIMVSDIDEPYRRINGTFDINEYGKLYDEIDVSLIPLVSSEFNRNKSQLKLIEAGFKKKACIVSDVIPYHDDITIKNCLPCGEKEWHKKIKYLVKNPNKIVDLGEELFEYVNERYRIDIVNIERKQIFESWLK